MFFYDFISLSNRYLHGYLMNEGFEYRAVMCNGNEI